MHALILTAILVPIALVWLALIYREARSGDGIEGECLHAPTPWIDRVWLAVGKTILFTWVMLCMALDRLGRKKAPARDLGRIWWFRPEATRRNLERWESWPAPTSPRRTSGMGPGGPWVSPWSAWCSWSGLETGPAEDVQEPTHRP